MRAIGLASVVAEAEAVRLRCLARRSAGRVVLGVVAGVFLMAALVAAHLGLWMAMQPALTPLQAVLLVGLADLVAGLVLAGLARWSRPGAAEREALMVRNAAALALVEEAVLLRIVRSVWKMARR